MNWLKNLPLEKIGEALAGFFGFWGRLTEGVPASQLPFIVYVVCCGLVLLLWLVVMRLIPQPFKGISLAVLAAVMRCLWWVQLGRWFEVCLWLMLKSRLG